MQQGRGESPMAFQPGVYGALCMTQVFGWTGVQGL